MARDVEKSCHPGDRAAVTFWTGNPRNAYRRDRLWASIERSSAEKWQPVARDGDWEVKCRWTRLTTDGDKGDEPLAAHRFTVEWDVPSDIEPGTYRITHYGCYRAETDGQLHEFETRSRSFEVE